MSAPIQSNGHESAAAANGNGHPASDNPGTSLATLIQDAEALHATLTDAQSEHRSPDRWAASSPQAVTTGE